MERAGRSPYWALFVGPYGVYLLVFLVLPFANVALLSVYLHSPTKIAVAEFTAANYAKLLELYYANLFLRTLRLSLVVTAVCVVLGYPLAYFLARSTSRIMTLGLFLLIMPLMVSTVIRVFGWVVILGSEGLVNQALRLLGAGEGVRLLYTEGAVILGLDPAEHAVHGPADHGGDRAHLAEPGGGGAEPRRELGPDVRARHRAVEHARSRLRRAARLQRVDERLHHARPDGRPPRADGGPADLRRGAHGLRLAGRGEPDDRPVGA